MRPFFTPLPGQIQPQSGNDPALHQQAMLLNPPQFPPSSTSAPSIPPGFDRPYQIRPLPSGQNPSFQPPFGNNPSNTNTHINNFPGSNPGISNNLNPNNSNTHFNNFNGSNPGIPNNLNPNFNNTHFNNFNGRNPGIPNNLNPNSSNTITHFNNFNGSNPGIPNNLNPNSSNTNTHFNNFNGTNPGIPNNMNPNNSNSHFNSFIGSNPGIPNNPNPNNSNSCINNFNGSNPGIPNNPNLVLPQCFPSVNQMGVLPQVGTQVQPQNLNQIITALQVLQENLPQLQGAQNLMEQMQNNSNLMGQMQNNGIGTLMQTGGLACNPNMQVGQLSMQNPLVNGSQIAPLQFNQQYPVRSMAPLNFPQPPRPLVGPTGFHDLGSTGNPQLSLFGLNSNLADSSHSNEVMQPSNQDHRVSTVPIIVGQNAFAQGPLSSSLRPQTTPLISTFPNQTNQRWNNMQHNRPRQPQMNNGHGYGHRDSTKTRFQNSQSHHMKNNKGLQNRGKSDQLSRCPEESHTEERRPLPVLYTEKEIKQWREARKKNFPTDSNIKKKVIRGNRDEAVKLRHQKVKKVLVKQTELGGDVAEIPPKCLNEPKEQLGEPKKSTRLRSKQGRDGRDCKIPRIENNESPDGNIKAKELSLLHKIRRSDIKRDKGLLLRVFRFMVSNSFFEEWPTKPLEFPRVAVEGIGFDKDDIFVDAIGLNTGKGTMNEKIEGQIDGSVADENDKNDDDDGDDDVEDGEILSHS